MVRKQDREHVKALLTEAITVLCKNGLGFESQLNIEALIGITLDKDEVFLVNINETVNARNTRVSSVIELSCEDVCQRDCPELEPESTVTSRLKIGSASSKRPKAHKRKHSSSSGSSDKPPKLEKFTDTDSNSHNERGEPAEKMIHSGTSSGISNHKKIELKDTKHSNEQFQSKQHHDSVSENHNSVKSDGKSSKSRILDDMESKGSTTKTKSEDGNGHSNLGKEQANNKHVKTQDEESRKVRFIQNLQ